MFGLGLKKVIGLDIDPSAVKMVQLYKDSKGCRAAAVGWQKIAPSSPDDEQSRNINTVAAIRRCVKEMGVKTRYAVCSVGGAEVAIRNFNFPALAPDEIEQAVLMEAAQVCPFGIEHSTVDYELLDRRRWLDTDKKGKSSKDEKDVCGVMVTAMDKVIRNKRELAQNAALKCVLMDADSLALVNCFAQNDKPQTGQSVALLNIGASYTNLVIVPHEGLPCMRDLPFAAAHIIEQLADEHGVSAEVIEQCLWDPKNDAPEPINIELNLENACRKLTSDINETIRYYRAQEQIPPVTMVLVGGSFALAAGLVELLDEQLPGKTVLWNPFKRIRYDIDTAGFEIIQKYGPALAVATGLALRTF